MNAAAQQAPEFELPPLRQDLQLCAGAPGVAGAAAWLIYDPVRHRYYQLSANAIDLLRCWQPVSISRFITLVNRETGRQPSEHEIRQLVQFIFANSLSETPPGNDPLAYAAQVKGARQTPLMRAVHGYLFFRIPLVRPERFLRATLPIVSVLYTRTAFIAIVITTLAGLYLASRQWDVFTATFLSMLSLESALLYGVALAFVKTLHELGHAYTATRYGIRVNTMGVAFMVLMPLLYTDVSDAWRLTRRRHKLMIDAAGLIVELGVAGIATLLWVFLPDGPVRSGVFIVATTSWILSLFVNINPFMRFDGYYLLSDAWGIPNLQSRAFAMARWQMREWLFDIAAKPPETFAVATRRWLIAYAFATWIYRFFLFIGIALIVYHMFFKVLGITLFVVEIIWFIALPIWREFKEWWQLRSDIMKTSRTLITLSVIAAALAAFVIPWNGVITIPATTWGAGEVRLFPSRAAQLEDLLVEDGQRVIRGQTIAVFHSDELLHKVALAQRRIKLLRARLARIAGDRKELADVAVLTSQLNAALQEQKGLALEIERLTMVAPFSGRILDLPQELREGRYLKATDPIGRLVAGAGKKARGYVSEEAVVRLKPGATGRFIPDNPVAAARRVTIDEISASGSDTLDNKYLASVYGGPVASDEAPKGGIKPRMGRHLVSFTFDTAAIGPVQRGIIHIEGEPESFAAAAWRRILKVLVRESGI